MGSCSAWKPGGRQTGLQRRGLQRFSIYVSLCVGSLHPQRISEKGWITYEKLTVGQSQALVSLELVPLRRERSWWWCEGRAGLKEDTGPVLRLHPVKVVAIFGAAAQCVSAHINQLAAMLMVCHIGSPNSISHSLVQFCSECNSKWSLFECYYEL